MNIVRELIRKKTKRKPLEMLDEPVFECKECRILFALKYLPVFDVIYCPRCAAKVGKHTTFRERYLMPKEEE